MPLPRDMDMPDAAERRRWPSPLGLTVRLAVAAAMVAGLSLLAGRVPRTADPVERPGPGAAVAGPASPVPAPSPDPLPAPMAPARLTLAEPGLDPVETRPGRVDPASGLREDGLGRGAFEALEAPALRITLGRGAGAERATGLFVLLARRAATGPALAILRTGAYGRIATKFGAVETLEVTLAGAVRRTCTGFVTREAAVRLDGWLCAPLGLPAEPAALACTLDALGLDDPADPAATAAFRAVRGDDCVGPRPVAEAAARTGSITRRARRPRK